MLGTPWVLWRTVVVSVLVFVPMLFEARLAAGNEQIQRGRGGVEPQGDVYRYMQVAYPGVFVAMLVESVMRPSFHLMWLVTGLLVFVLGKGLKYWAIGTLGPHWTFRVIVVPGSTPVTSGPYRMFSHPNYVGVTGELLGVALMTEALTMGPLGVVLFVALMVRRVAVENRARDVILRH